MSYDPRRDKCPSEPLPAVRELCTEAGAQVLARQLDAWWHSRGFDSVQHWVERARWLPGNGRRPNLGAHDNIRSEGLWIVRSNLVNGMPPHQGPMAPRQHDSPGA